MQDIMNWAWREDKAFDTKSHNETLKLTLKLQFQLSKKVLNIFMTNKTLTQCLRKASTKGIENDIDATLKK